MVRKDALLCQTDFHSYTAKIFPAKRYVWQMRSELSLGSGPIRCTWCNIHATIHYRLFHRHQHATVWDHTRILNINLSATSSNLSGPSLVMFNFRRLISVTYVFSSFFCVSGCNLYHMSWIWPCWSFEKTNEAWKKNCTLSSTDSSLRQIVIGPKMAPCIFLSTMTIRIWAKSFIIRERGIFLCLMSLRVVSWLIVDREYFKHRIWVTLCYVHESLDIVNGLMISLPSQNTSMYLTLSLPRQSSCSQMLVLLSQIPNTFVCWGPRLSDCPVQ